MVNTLWFPGTRKPGAKFRLFCLPFGGGGSIIYREWQSLFPPNIDVCPIQLPGRENRLKEKAFTNISDLEKELLPLLKPLLDLPYAFFGHSFGALVAYQLSKSLKPNHLFVSAFTSPTISNPRAIQLKARFSAAGLSEAYNKNEFTPDQIKTIIQQKIFTELDKIPPEIASMYVKIGSADMKVVDSYLYDNKILSCPITAFCGSEDADVSESDMQAWQSLTGSTFKLVKIPGDHLFIMEKNSRLEVIREIMLSSCN